MSEILSLVRKACEAAADKVPLHGTQEELEQCLVTFLQNLSADKMPPFDVGGRLNIDIDDINKLAPEGVVFRAWPVPFFSKADKCCRVKDQRLILLMPKELRIPDAGSILSSAYNVVLKNACALIVAAIEPRMKAALLDEAFTVDSSGVISLNLSDLPKTVGGQSLNKWHVLVFRAWLETQGLPPPPRGFDFGDRLYRGEVTITCTLPAQAMPANFGALTAIPYHEPKKASSEVSFLKGLFRWFDALRND